MFLMTSAGSALTIRPMLKHRISVVAISGHYIYSILVDIFHALRDTGGHTSWNLFHGIGRGWTAWELRILGVVVVCEIGRCDIMLRIISREIGVAWKDGRT